MVVYVDVLIALNLYINYFLIRATAMIMRRVCSRKRCVLSALVGALGALMILLPELPFFAVVLFKIALGTIIVLITFGRQKPADIAVCALFFLVVSFTFAGVMIALWTFSAPLGMVWSNGTAYFNIPIAALAAFTAAAYCAIRLVRFIADKRLHCNKICSVKITDGAHTVELRGLCDTGNELCDLFSGKPVVICLFDKIMPIVPQSVLDYFDGKIPENLRVIPFRTLASKTAETLIHIFKADITIDGKATDGFAGVTKNPLGNDVDCVFNPKIISM
ncbi:MAG: sigma-E processing peptidase SpoIIGA [Oscillospiraceae bacterium]|nr:sigma-E processing peptidase SpoIIGA [Oscillospiraceae bacterium]